MPRCESRHQTNREVSKSVPSNICCDRGRRCVCIADGSNLAASAAQKAPASPAAADERAEEIKSLTKRLEELGKQYDAERLLAGKQAEELTKLRAALKTYEKKPKALKS